MKHTELRIGNYLQYNGQIVQVTGVDSEFVYLNIVTFDYVEHDEVEPVELTAERLIEMGFRQETMWNHKRQDYDLMPYYEWQPEGDNWGMLRYYMEGAFLRIYGEDFQTSYPDIEMAYVHELQNLLYSLHKIELTIKTV
jgi:hypothetical protein